MRRQSGGTGGRNGAGGIQPHTWKGTHALAGVRQLNGHFLEVLEGLAGADSQKLVPHIIRQYRTLWHGMGPESRARAAATPVLLLDIQLRNDDWWNTRRARSVRRAKAVQASPTIPAKRASELVRETLMLGCVAARDDRFAAKLLFGMSNGVAAIVAGLTSQDIDRIASRSHGDLRLRWEDVPTFWLSLLKAARSDDAGALREIHLYSLQLLGRELVPPLRST